MKSKKTVKPENKKPQKQDITYFTTRKTSTVKFNTSFVKFANLYAVKNNYTKYIIAACAGFLMSIVTIFLVEVTGLYTGGTTAFFQGLSRFFSSLINVFCADDLTKSTRDLLYNLMFWGFYLVVNIPLLIFAFFKLNKRFALLSATYLISMQVFGFIWSFVPGIHDIMLFGSTTTVDENLREFNIKVITFSPNIFPGYLEPSHNFDWDHIHSYSSIKEEMQMENIIFSITSKNITEFFLLIVYALVFSIFSSLFGAVMYMISGSTAGGDIITIYYSQEKHKNLGFIMIIYNSIMMILGVLFGSYLSGVVYGFSPEFKAILDVSPSITSNPYVGWQYIVSGNLVASFIWVMAHGSLIDRLFPWHKMVRVEIFTTPTNVNKINDELKLINFTHPTTLFNATGGYSKGKVATFVTLIQCIELPEFIQVVRSIDEKCLISTVRMADIDGYMTVQKQTC